MKWKDRNWDTSSERWGRKREVTGYTVGDVRKERLRKVKKLRDVPEGEER